MIELFYASLMRDTRAAYEFTYAVRFNLFCSGPQGKNEDRGSPVKVDSRRPTVALHIVHVSLDERISCPSSVVARICGN